MAERIPKAFRRENDIGFIGDMREVWCHSLSRFSKPPSSLERRAKQATLVQLIKDELVKRENVKLQTEPDLNRIDFLHTTYCSDSRWCLNLARQQFPNEWPHLLVHFTTATAYGLRVVEQMTGQQIDARQPLPMWIGEWAIW